MITFTQLGKLGRFGNQLFQYSMVKSVALESGRQLKIPNPEHTVWQNQKSYLSYYDLDVDFLTSEDIRKIQYRFIEQDHANFYPEVFSTPDNIDFYGYFQNYRYFSKYLTNLKKEFVMKDEISDKAAEYLSSFDRDWETSG